MGLPDAGRVGVLSASGMGRSTLLELSGMELYEVAHVRRRFADELAHGVRHAVGMALVQTRRLNPVCWHVELGEVRQ